MLKIALHKLTPKSDVETKIITKVETYLKKDCNNMKGVWVTRQARKKGVPATHITVTARHWAGEVASHKTKGKVLSGKHRCIKFKVIV